MVSSLVIGLREGLEAALVIGILLAYLARIGRSDRAGSVWLGTGLAILASLLAGGIIFLTASELEGPSEALFEGVTLVLAVAVLAYMIRWMHRQARDLKGSLQQQVAAVLDGGPRRGLAALAFLVVVREGLETALLLFGAAETSSPTTMLFGSLLGLTAAAGLGYAIYRGALRLDLRAFFNTTGILLVFFAAGMLASSVHEFIEVGLLPGIVEPVWDLSATLSDDSAVGQFLKVLLGYNPSPSLLEVVAYLTFLGAMLQTYLRLPVLRARTASDSVGQ